MAAQQAKQVEDLKSSSSTQWTGRPQPPPFDKSAATTRTSYIIARPFGRLVITTPPPQQKVLNALSIGNVFTLYLLEVELYLLHDIYDEVENGAEEYGEVRNVARCEKEPRGLVTVRFADAAIAGTFAAAIDG
ncbi:hypothetical protein PRZ48_008875 [Zasmidium cellare]|uniref:RRM domain-containing protein n=1 Tax=Zasmidium cellare TaxID=395010 RepID=A0ABR0EGQ2_ZASCE|nr:hypothetical protein PRZ48_008875 [Zasmidium cellare]